MDEKKLTSLLQEYVKPFVKKIDSTAYYKNTYLKQLGSHDYFQSSGNAEREILLRESRVVKETSRICMTTGFTVWCHLAFLTYLRNSTNEKLKRELLPKFESGEMIGGTALSNPMKAYAGLEKLHLHAVKTEGGFLVSGTFPAVSNLAQGHWFAIVADLENGEKIAAVVSSDQKGLRLKEQDGFLGVNGSATYSCQFQDCFVSNDRLLSDDTDAFVERMRSTFVFYQIPLIFGVAEASFAAIHDAKDYQFGANRYLPVQLDELKKKYQTLSDEATALTTNFQAAQWKDILSVRLKAALFGLRVTQAEMLHKGSSGYLQQSASSRRLRESYFYINLTPSVRHLSKLLNTLR